MLGIVDKLRKRIKTVDNHGSLLFQKEQTTQNSSAVFREDLIYTASSVSVGWVRFQSCNDKTKKAI